MLMVPQEEGPRSTPHSPSLQQQAGSPHTSSVSLQHLLHHHCKTRPFLFTHRIHSFKSVCILSWPTGTASLIFLVLLPLLFPCLLLWYSHWSHLIPVPCQTLPVCRPVCGLCSLSALPVTSHSSLNVQLNADWGPSAHYLVVIYSNKYNVFPPWRELLRRHALRQWACSSCLSYSSSHQ